MTSDIELMTAFQQGDAEAFEKLVLRHQTGVYNFFIRMLRDRQTAEDYTQEVFFKLYRSAKNYRPEAKLTTYMYRIARNCFIDHVRKVKRKGTTASLDKEFEEGLNLYDHLAADTDAPDANLERSDQAGLIQQAIESLPEEQRLVFVLSEVQEMKYAEIAEALEIPLGTVKSRMHTAIHRLREILERSGITEHG